MVQHKECNFWHCFNLSDTGVSCWWNVFINTLGMGRLHIFFSVPSSNMIELNLFTSIFTCIFISITPKFFTKEKMRRAYWRTLIQNICAAVICSLYLPNVTYRQIGRKWSAVRIQISLFCVRTCSDLYLIAHSGVFLISVLGGFQWVIICHDRW